MLRDKPCPDRIFDDLGGGFSMGCVMGAVFHFARGVLLSTSGEKLFGGISCLKKRAPLLAGRINYINIGSFAMWAGVYSIS
jgi:import inner membrane translocase subunit TIM17